MAPGAGNGYDDMQPVTAWVDIGNGLDWPIAGNGYDDMQPVTAWHWVGAGSCLDWLVASNGWDIDCVRRQEPDAAGDGLGGADSGWGREARSKLIGDSEWCRMTIVVSASHICNCAIGSSYTWQFHSKWEGRRCAKQAGSRAKFSVSSQLAQCAAAWPRDPERARMQRHVAVGWLSVPQPGQRTPKCRSLCNVGLGNSAFVQRHVGGSGTCVV